MREVVTVGPSPADQRTHRLARESQGSGDLPDLKTSDSLATGPLSNVPNSAWALTREYIHAAEPGAYVDEVLAQVVYTDAAGDPVPAPTPPVVLYTLRDANYNVVALADEFGDSRHNPRTTPSADLSSGEIALYAVRDASNSIIGYIDETAMPAAVFKHTFYGEFP